MPSPGDPPLTLDRVAIFPLPETVLFPHTQLPLHIFEPRYRKMTEDCIEGGLPMAVTLAKPGEDLAGVAEVFPIAGVGVIERHERLQDGRYNIVLRGVTRIRIVEEIPHRPYRMVRAEPLSDRWPAATAPLDTAAATLRACVLRVVRLASEPEIASEVLRRMEAAKDAAFLADTVAGMFLADARARQEILEQLDVAARVDAVTSGLADLLLRAEAARGGGETVQ